MRGEFGKSNESTERFGGPGRDRTDDLFHAMEARSQLRHRPTCEKNSSGFGLREETFIILAYILRLVNAPQFTVTLTLAVDRPYSFVP
jgi:hypothetical protein